MSIQVIHKIGQGSSGTIYKVNYNESEYAMKKVNYKNFITNINEIEIMSRIIHPNIISLRVFIFRNNTIYMFFELAEMNLHHVKILTNELKNKYILQLISVIKYLHDHEIYHGDIKPENILIKNKNIYLTDFGLSSYSYTMNHHAPQTIWFAPPSLSDDSESSDNWALGLCIIYIIRLKYLFMDNTYEELYESHNTFFKDPIKYIGHTDINIIPYLRLLNKNPSKRKLDEIITESQLICGNYKKIDRSNIYIDTSKQIYLEMLVDMINNNNNNIILTCIDLFFRTIDLLTNNNFISYLLAIIIIVENILIYEIRDIDYYINLYNKLNINEITEIQKMIMKKVNGIIVPIDLFKELKDEKITVGLYKKLVGLE